MHEGFNHKSCTQKLYTPDGVLSQSVRHWTLDKWPKEEPVTEDKSLHGMHQ